MTISSHSYRWFAVTIWALLVALAIASILDTQDGIARLAVLPSFAFFAWLVWFGLWRPDMTIDDDGITVRNVLSTVRVPWNALVHVSTKYALTLHTPTSNIAVFAAPQPGRFAGWRAMRRVKQRGSDDEQKLVSDRTVHVGELPGTESGDAAAYIRQRWEAGLADGTIAAGVAEETSIDRHWHIGTITAFGFGLVLSLVGGGIIAMIAQRVG